MTETEKLGGMLIFCIVFLGLFIALMTIGNDFFVNSTSYRQYVTGSLDAGSFVALNYSKTNEITFPDSSVMFDFNPNINVKLSLGWTVLSPYLELTHIHSEFAGYYYNYQTMYFENETKTLLSRDDLVTAWSPNASAFYPVRDGDLTVHLFITDTNETRNNIGDAWDEGKLKVNIGFGIDDYQASLTAWDIIGRLLLFQTPEIMGLTGDVAFIITFMIALPIYTCIAYLLYRLIIMAIPFLSG